ncbi:hypothetical protein SprV_0100434300 [Sparganum proliferum]
MSRLCGTLSKASLKLMQTASTDKSIPRDFVQLSMDVSRWSSLSVYLLIKRRLLGVHGHEKSDKSFVLSELSVNLFPR